MVYYTYKITCLLGSFKGKYYFGQRHTDKMPDDKYCGSGTLLGKYYKKYGKIEGETYIKEIIQFYNSPEELNKAEYELIGDKYETDDMCLNLRAGGMQCGMSQESIEKARAKNKLHVGWHHKEETKIKQSVSAKKHPPNALGHVDSEETKQKRRDSLKGHKSASQDKVWINNGTQETYISQHEVESYLGNGWETGRLSKGYAWMNKGNEEIQVNKTDVNTYLSKGYVSGRLKKTT